MEKSLKNKKFLTLAKGLAGFASILFVMLVVFSCNNLLVRNGGSLVISTPGARSASASSYTIELTGANGTTQRKTVTSGTTVQFDDLAPGTYNIVVEGIDTNNKVVLGGASSATVVAGETASTTVELVEGVSDFAGLQAAVTAGGTVYVLTSIDVETTLSVPSGISVTILPAYQDVTLKNTSTGNLFTFPSGSTGNLTIGGGNYIITLDGNQSTSPIISMSGGTATLADNGIIRNAAAEGVSLSSGTFNMTGGTIEKNTKGVNVQGGGTFTMKEGKITGNNGSDYGVGVTIGAATFKMEGGEISNNTTSYDYGGGVAIISSNGTFNFSGGSITGNVANSAGNGVYVTGGIFKMSGSAVVASNNDVYLFSLVSSKITVAGILSGTTPVATITPASYAASTQVLSAESGVDLAVMVEKFAVTPNPAAGSEWIIDTAGILQKGISDFASLQAAVATGGTVYVLKSIDVSSVLTVETTVEILPAYQDVTLKNIGSENLFFVRPNGNLTIGGGEHTITLNGNQVAKEILKMTGGIVTLTPNGIISNAASTGVSVQGGTFNMTGGSITGNIGSDGGGVNLSSATFNMTGGSISGNTVTGFGGGVFMATGSFSMTGGSIDNNSAVNDGNGVYISTGAFSMSGSAVIASNNDVYLDTGIHITVSGEITAEDEFIATLTPASYAEGTQVLNAGDGVTLANEVGKFAVTPQSNGTQWTIDASGYLKEQ